MRSRASRALRRSRLSRRRTSAAVGHQELGAELLAMEHDELAESLDGMARLQQRGTRKRARGGRELHTNAGSPSPCAATTFLGTSSAQTGRGGAGRTCVPFSTTREW